MVRTCKDSTPKWRMEGSLGWGLSGSLFFENLTNKVVFDNNVKKKKKKI